MHRSTLLLGLAALSGCGGLAYYDGSTPGTDATDPSGTLTGTDPTDTDPGPTDPGPTDPGGTTDPGTTTDPGGTTPAPAPIVLDTLTPDYGSNAGGALVHLEGDFDSATTFHFNGTAGTIQRLTLTEADVFAPSVAVSGWVDVEARSGARTDRLPGAFQYWPDATGDSGVVGALNLVHMVGGYWATPTDSAYGLFAFTDPGSWELRKDYSATLGTCALNYTGAGLPATVDTGASSVRFASGGSTALLGASAQLGTGWFADFGLTPGVEVVPGQTYDLDPVAGNADWPGFGLTNAIEVPGAFNVTAPNLGGTNLPTTNSSIDLTWTGGGGDYVLIWVLRQFIVSGTWYDDGVVTCAVPDTGSYTIPVSVWGGASNWFAGDLLHIQVGRAYVQNAPMPHDNSQNRAGGVYWVYGAAETL